MTISANPGLVWSQAFKTQCKYSKTPYGCLFELYDTQKRFERQNKNFITFDVIYIYI